MTAWELVPKGNPRAPLAALERGKIALSLGRFRWAEESLRQAWSDGKPEIREQAYKQLGWLFQIQGRHRDIRRLIERAGDLSSWALRTSFLLDVEPAQVEAIRETLDEASRSPHADDGLWLAEANLALRQGDLTAADRWLAKCEAAHPDDPVISQSRLDWAVAAGRPDQAARAIEVIGSANLAQAEIPALTAWFARRRSDIAAEHAALEALLQWQPADTAALERLAELELRQGHSNRVAELRRRKTELDAIKERYRRLIVHGDSDADCALAARLAESLGRRYEARGWAQWWHRQSPADRDAQALRDRLAGEKSTTIAPSAAFAALLDQARTFTSTAETSTTKSDLESIRFENQAESLGLRFTYDNGKSDLRQLPETMNGGVGLLDYDGDGWLDLYVVQGGRFPPEPNQRGDRLFRNRRDGSFLDATHDAGIDQLPQGYGHGVAVADYDNDGDPDLFITRWRSYSLYRNDGGRFVDVTADAGLAGDRDWPTSAAFADLDNDGDLDLYVCHYLQWDPENPRPCKRKDTGERTYCTPAELPALPDHLYRNDGGRFVDVSEEAGITAADTDGRGLGVLAAQLDDDMKIDLFVANDMSANYLFRNQGGVKFAEVAHASGVAGNAEGSYLAGMGIGCGDADGDGRTDLVVTNFYGEGTTLYHNLGGGLFTDRADESGVRVASRYRLGFGIAFLDADNDGRLDLLAANGHVNNLRGIYPYAMPAQLLRNVGEGRFRDVSGQAGEALAIPHVGRGLAQGDLDHDGLLDAVILVQNEPLVVLRNRTAEAGHWLTLRIEGTTSNRDGVGTVVKIQSASGGQTRQRFGGGSYQSAGDPRLHFGLGPDTRVDHIEVRWPSGKLDHWKNLKAESAYLIREGAPPTPLSEFSRNLP